MLACLVRRLRPGTWLKSIDFGCAQPVEPGVPLTRKTGTPMFMVRTVSTARLTALLQCVPDGIMRTAIRIAIGKECNVLGMCAGY